MQQRGLAGIADMNPSAKYPCMEPSGSKNPLIYMLGEAPSLDDDREGRHFAGPAGKLLRPDFGTLTPKIRFNNCVRTHPSGGRLPSISEVECFRQSVVDDIQETKPKIIVAVGALAAQWLLPKLGKISVLRGRRFPVTVGTHSCWVYPIYHPSYILRIKDKREADVAGVEYLRVFHADNEAIVKNAHCVPETDIIDGSCNSGIEFAYTVKKVEAALEKLSKEKYVAFDLETTRLRPYYADSEILSIAIAGSDFCVGIPIDHPQSPFTVSEKAKVKDLLWNWLLSPSRKIAQNASFDIEWLTWWFGPDAARASSWEDTMVQSYVLDSRPGGKGLDFMIRQYFGFSLKSLSNVNFKDLGATPLDELLSYNCLDSKWTLPLFKVQQARIKKDGLLRIYEEHIRRIPTVILAQAAGLPVDVDRVEAFQAKYTTRIEAVRGEIATLPEVIVYEQEFGHFNPASTPQLVTIFRDILKRPEGQRAGTKYSTDKKALGVMEEVPLAEKILELRTLVKLKSTYIDKLHPDAKGSDTYPDGRIHPLFKTVSTVTGRLSSSEPNGQNFPKRTNPEIRSQIVALPGWSMVSVDYGQIEARVIAMASGDKYLLAALWEDYDIHMHWTERVIEVWPKIFKQRGGDKKKFRGDIKNQFTFPLFYGSRPKSIAKALSMPDGLADRLYDEFWDTFPTVLKWQSKLKKDYQKKGYVETLTGRRRYAPMSTNMVINTPVQGTASDIVVDAMNRLSEYADEKQVSWLQPVLNIHDDLTFLVPNSELDGAIEIIKKMMLVCDYAWSKDAPIEIEMAVGPDWFRLEEIGKFQSHKV